MKLLPISIRQIPSVTSTKESGVYISRRAKLFAISSLALAFSGRPKPQAKEAALAFLPAVPPLILRLIKTFMLMVALGTLALCAQESREYSGVQAIQELYNGWLIVRLPGFEKKLAAIDSLLEIHDLSEKARRDLERQRTSTLNEREFIYKWYPVMFDSAYTFSKAVFIYTHETDAFQSWHLPARTSSGEPVPSVQDDVYFFATLQGVRSDPFVFTSKDHRILAYPFPNRIALPGFIFPDLIGPPVPDWIKALEEKYTPVYRVYRHVYRINKKLRAFYDRG